MRMKKLTALILVYSILFSSLVWARPLLVGPRVVYKGTVTGLRISAVDGTAFLDALPTAATDLVTAIPGEYKFEIYDSAGRQIHGVGKAVGTAETLDSELITAADDRTFASDTGWWVKTGSGWGISGGVATHTGTTAGLMTSGAVLTDNTLVKSAMTVNGGSLALLSSPLNKTIGGIGAQTVYFNPGLTTLAFYTATNAVTVDDVSLKKVLTPSTAGCTIVTAKGGTTYNFTYKNPSFVFNAASYYVVIKKLR